MRVYLSTTESKIVDSYEEASIRVREHIAMMKIPYKKFTGGRVETDRGNEIAKVTYSGKVWPIKGFHRTPLFQPTPGDQDD